MPGSSKPTAISLQLQRIAKTARERPDMAFLSLNHCLDLELLREAYRRTRKDGSPGVDGVTAQQYAEQLEDNLQGLLERAHTGLYRAPPVQRRYIPKGSGSERRPIGMPTFEDKVLQRAVATILGAIYEQDFLDCSYGFRPGRSAHQALQSLWQATMKGQGCWVVEVDLRKYFDTVDHGQLREILRQRVRDGVLLRLIGKWLNAGVLEAGRIRYPEEGTPQGGVISPLLANVYLHTVLDLWFHRDVRPRLAGRAFLIRYADDFVLGFEHEADARRVFEVLAKRFAKYGLTVHPKKSRMLDFRKPSPPGRQGPGSFDFLGFTHFWDRSRKGNWVVRKKTAPDRFRRTIRTLNQWCRRHRHWKIRAQHPVLVAKLRGHDQYFGVIGNWRSLWAVRHVVRRVWQKWLTRRSPQHAMTWPRFLRVLKRYPLPTPRIGAAC